MVKAVAAVVVTALDGPSPWTAQSCTEMASAVAAKDRKSSAADNSKDEPAVVTVVELLLETLDLIMMKLTLRARHHGIPGEIF
jgi:hypothetical protein